MYLLKIATVPAPAVSLQATVSQAVEAMMKHRVGAVAVVSDGALRGIFTERDVMGRVVAARRDPASTTVEEVMTSQVESIPETTKAVEALNLMVERHFRHLPITDGHGNLRGMLSVRNLLQNQIEYLSHELNGMEAYMTADGIGG